MLEYLCVDMRTMCIDDCPGGQRPPCGGETNENRAACESTTVAASKPFGQISRFGEPGP